MSIFKKDNRDWADKLIDFEKSKKNAPCKHEGKTDLTHGRGETRNFYCPNCKRHWYRGRIWSEDDWYKYVNDMSDKSFVIYKPTGRKEEIKRVRDNGNIELMNGGIINIKEFDMNWRYANDKDSK